MWFDGSNVFINMDHVDYISFSCNEEKCTAIVYFNNGDLLNFEHNDLDKLKSFFRKVFENGKESKVG